MDSTNFAYWLKGFFEMTDAKTLSPNQVLMIKEHLKLVFDQKTPQIDPNYVPVTPTPWVMQPICSPGPLDNGVSVGPNTEPYKVKITCDAPNGIGSGVSTNQNLDLSLLCSQGPVGLTGHAGSVDEHSHAGQAKRTPVNEIVLGPSGSWSGFVVSKMPVTC